MFSSNTSQVQGAGADPQFNYVTMLLHGDGTNGAQNNTFLDSSTNAFSITRNGNTTQGSFSPYGSLWSNYFNGSTGYLTVPNNTNWVLGTAYTIEAWVNFSDLSGQDIICGSNSRWWLSRSLTDTGVASGKFGFSTNTGTWNAISSTTTPVAGVWYHVAVTISSGTVSLYVNGVLEASASRTIPTDNFDLLDIGTWNGGVSTYAINGYISNLRLVKGSVLYTGSSFTPPTAPLTAVTNTVLLTCQSNRFIDNSTNNFTITRNGDVSVQRFSPFAPSAAYSTATNGGSGYFPSAGSTALVCGSSSNLALGSGNFTVELWTYVEALAPSYSVFLDWRTAGSYGLYYPILGDFNNNGKLTFTYSPNNSSFTTVVESSVSIPLKQWLHIAVVRNGSTVTMYFNGNSVGSGSDSSTFANQTLNVGNPQASNYTPNAYISDVRIVKGSAVYTGSFTPPAAPLTAITNTQLLLNFTNAAIFDNAMMNDLETVGNAQISTSVKKYGTGSLAFDGSGDYLTIPNSQNFVFNAGNWTLECWVYLNTTGRQGFVQLGNVAGNNVPWELGLNASNKFRVLVQTSAGQVVIDGTTTPSTATWYHLAAVRNGGTVTLYVNGTSEATGNVSTNALVAETNVVNVGQYSYGFQMNGYIDDLRITKGYARYTANFTPPTAAFPNN